MSEMGKAMMGTGEATGDDRALLAAQNAIANPLLDETSLKGAKAVLVNVTGGMDMTLLEVDEAANAISSEVDPEANIIFGAAFDPALQGKIRVSVVATGMDGAAISKIEPKAEPRRAHAVSEIQTPVIEPVMTFEPEPDFESLRPAAYAEGGERIVFGGAEAPRIDNAAREIREPIIEDIPTAASWDEARDGDRPIARIIDPMVEDDDIAQPDLYLDTPVVKPSQPIAATPEPEPEYEEEPRRGGWRSLFGGGRPRYEEKQASFGRARPEMRQTQQAEPEIEPEAAPATEAQDDLEIPSFLRRLAN
jgi:cell division protein FtsZ